MKNLLVSTTVLAIAFLLQSFVFSGVSTEKNVGVKESKVVWKAYKVAGSHEGTIDVKTASLDFDGEKLVGGNFMIDMATIACTDLEGEYKGKLEGHLKSGDFFDVEKHNTASLNITKAKSSGKNSYKLVGDLTIKDITKSVKFEASIYGKKATASLKIDRTDFDIKYGSGSFFDGLKDNMIYDEFDLVVDIAF
jgi:polyisoprenoid-binding protein YceI